FGDDLVIAHVLEPPAEPLHSLAVTDLAPQMRVKAARELKAAAEELRAQDLDVTERLEAGTPHEVLVVLAHELDVRLVVLGTHGRGAVGRALFGSVAQRVLLEADRPVLLVRPGRPA